MSLEKPRKVQDARLRDDRDALRRMGRKGAKASAEKRRLKREHQQQIEDSRAAILAEDLKKVQSERHDKITPDGDVLPSDQNTDLEEK